MKIEELINAIAEETGLNLEIHESSICGKVFCHDGFGVRNLDGNSFTEQAVKVLDYVKGLDYVK